MSGAEEPVRAFFAVALPEPTRQAVARVSHSLRALPGGEGVRWVGPASYHLTLRFLGEIAPSRIPQLLARVGAELRELPPFRMTLHEPHLFPSPRRPRVVALEARPEDRLGELAEAVRRGVERAGFPRETRPFRAHLTLGRIRGGCFPRPAEVGSPETAPVPVHDVVLLRSQLRREGAVYTVLEQVVLGGSDPDVEHSPLIPNFEGEDHGKERTQGI